jgi:hypothetical protein
MFREPKGWRCDAVLDAQFVDNVSAHGESIEKRSIGNTRVQAVKNLRDAIIWIANPATAIDNLPPKEGLDPKAIDKPPQRVDYFDGYGVARVSCIQSVPSVRYLPQGE